MTKYVTYKSYTESQINLIGKIAIEGALLDFILSALLSNITDEELKYEKGNILNKSTREKAKLLKGISLPALQAPLDKVEGILDDRNVVIHGIQAVAEDGRLGHIDPQQRLTTRPHELTEEWLQSLVDRIAELNGAFIETNLLKLTPP